MTDMGRKQWKMTAVALLGIIVQLSPIPAETRKEAKSSTSASLPQIITKDCLEAYSQAWEIIDFFDRAEYSYTEDSGISREAGDGVTSEAGDKIYSRVLKKRVVPFRDPGQEKSPHNVTEALTPLKKDCKSKTENLVSIKANHGLKDKETPHTGRKLHGGKSCTSYGSALTAMKIPM